MDKRELARQQREQELWIRQHNTYVKPAEEVHPSQPRTRAAQPTVPKAQPGKAFGGVLLFAVGLAVGVAYPSKVSAVFALVAVVLGGSWGIDGIRSRRTD